MPTCQTFACSARRLLVAGSGRIVVTFYAMDASIQTPGKAIFLECLETQLDVTTSDCTHVTGFTDGEQAQTSEFVTANTYAKSETSVLRSAPELTIPFVRLFSGSCFECLLCV